MKDRRSPMITVEEALRIVLGESRAMPAEETALESAAGRVLAEEIHADADQPPFAKAMMDGYALRSSDATQSGSELEVVEEIPAGAVPSKALGPGQAARIMTGAPTPAGSDAVQMVEKTASLDGGCRVRILEPVKSGAHIAPKGQEIRSGDLLLSAGTLLTPARIGILAGAGRARVSVRRRPRAAVMPTGDELVPSGVAPGPGQIRNSNGPALAAAIRLLGAEVQDLGIVPDDLQSLRGAIRRGLESDLLLLSGGVSMGERDLAEQALEEEGVEILFRSIAIRPGKPAVFGRKGDCRVFGLPGNPVSTMVIFEVLVSPLVRAFSQAKPPEGSQVEAELESPVTQSGGRTSYLPGRLSVSGARARIKPIPSTGSADLLAYARANALFIVPSDKERIDAGETVRVLLLNSAPYLL